MAKKQFKFFSETFPENNSIFSYHGQIYNIIADNDKGYDWCYLAGTTCPCCFKYFEFPYNKKLISSPRRRCPDCSKIYKGRV